MDPDEARRIVRGMILAGERLPVQLRADILALGAAAIPPLVEILVDDDLTREDSPGDGWAPPHAALLLGALRATEAVQPMLRMLAVTDAFDVLHDRLMQALPELGPAVLEPALQIHAAIDRDVFRSSVASILARIGQRDDRIFALLLERLRADPGATAGDLAEYGDVSALPHLSRAFDDHPLTPDESPLANHAMVELRAAIEDLGGTLTAAQQEKYRASQEPADHWRRQLNAALTRHTPAQRVARPGRNEPCWCGSSKKYKKCHLSADEVTASPAQRVRPGEGPNADPAR